MEDERDLIEGFLCLFVRSPAEVFVDIHSPETSSKPPTPEAARKPPTTEAARKPPPEFFKRASLLRKENLQIVNTFIQFFSLIFAIGAALGTKGIIVGVVLAGYLLLSLFEYWKVCEKVHQEGLVLGIGKKKALNVFLGFVVLGIVMILVIVVVSLVLFSCN